MTQEEFAQHFKLGKHSQVHTAREKVQQRLSTERKTMFHDVAPLELPDFGECPHFIVVVVLTAKVHSCMRACVLACLLASCSNHCIYFNRFQSTGFSSVELHLSRIKEPAVVAGHSQQLDRWKVRCERQDAVMYCCSYWIHCESCVSCHILIHFIYIFLPFQELNLF